MHTYKLMRVVLAAAMLSSVMLASAAIESRAADAPRRPVYPVPPPPLIYNWTGLYAGIHAGAGWADLGVGDTATGFIGGGQVGFNYQVNQWVWGLEAEISGSGIKNNLATFGPFTASFNWNSLTTLTPRFGYAFDNWLVYGKVGGAWTDCLCQRHRVRRFTLLGRGDRHRLGGWCRGGICFPEQLKREDRVQRFRFWE